MEDPHSAHVGQLQEVVITWRKYKSLRGCKLNRILFFMKHRSITTTSLSIAKGQTDPSIGQEKV